MSDEQWFYCLKHGTVEGPQGCRAADRLGPYPDRETAARALEIARERPAGRVRHLTAVQPDGVVRTGSEPVSVSTSPRRPTRMRCSSSG